MEECSLVFMLLVELAMAVRSKGRTLTKSNPTKTSAGTKRGGRHLL